MPTFALSMVRTTSPRLRSRREKKNASTAKAAVKERSVRGLRRRRPRPGSPGSVGGRSASSVSVAESSSAKTDQQTHVYVHSGDVEVVEDVVRGRRCDRSEQPESNRAGQPR